MPVPVSHIDITAGFLQVPTLSFGIRPHLSPEFLETAYFLTIIDHSIPELPPPAYNADVSPPSYNRLFPFYHESRTASTS